MIANRYASKDADSAMAATTTLARKAGGSEAVEDMICIGNMRLPDLFSIYKRRVAMARTFQVSWKRGDSSS